MGKKRLVDRAAFENDWLDLRLSRLEVAQRHGWKHEHSAVTLARAMRLPRRNLNSPSGFIGFDSHPEPIPLPPGQWVRPHRGMVWRYRPDAV